MEKKILLGIVGYGNLGKGAELAIGKNPDMELIVIFTRRDPSEFKSESSSAVFKHISDAKSYSNQLDALILCGGSATDLPEQGPVFAKMFNTIDSYDTHAKIPEYFARMDETARQSGKIAFISSGWDPGLFSVLRVLGESILPDGHNYTFWGPGVSQGHSDAIRRIKGVRDARQYTLPTKESIEKVRSGKNPELTTREKHIRQCYVVAHPGEDLEQIRREIVEMPNYFADYETHVNFITEEELLKNHGRLPHGGFVFRSGQTSQENKQLLEFNLKLDSNSEFTSSVLVACARAVVRLNREKIIGAKTFFDIPIGYLSIQPPEALRKSFL